MSLKFGNFVLDPGARQLRRGGEARHLGPKAFELLSFLLFALLVWLLGGQIAAAFNRQSRFAARRTANRLALLQESLKMQRLVKGYLMEGFNQSRIERQLADYAAANMQRVRGEAAGRPLLTLLGTLAAVTLLYLAGRIVRLAVRASSHDGFVPAAFRAAASFT